MLQSHEKFYSKNGKRLVLVVDDEAINRELLGFILSEDFDVLYAENGDEALGLIREHSRHLSLVLLDLMMPVMDGFTLLGILKQDETLQRIPIIVLTSEKNAEVRSLVLGASDFITKPYDMPEVILARVRRTIELAEDTYIIQNTERDELTGLYTREYFYRYAEQYDKYHTGRDMDALVVDINHFHLINELYGHAFGDMVLQKIADKVQEIAEKAGGLASRQESDKFLLYMPHEEAYQEVYDEIFRVAEQIPNARIRLRMGIYPAADKTLDVSRRFDRAKMAADTVRANYTRNFALYDHSFHEKELYKERLVDEMDEALEQGQFRVFYQPKYDVRGDVPLLRSAEALVRWQHPRLGMISPGVFIPLFEENGLIQKLDRYVWQTAMEQICHWKEKFGIVIPVSVNVSRVDMYDPALVDVFRNLIRKNDLAPQDCLLEITESAYTEDSDQIIRVVEDLRALGFRVEMDDFGSGYSSLNMLSQLPIDVLKLDMKFIKNIRGDGKAVRMLELMMDIARYLSVPVVAEGVEQEEQMLLLKKLGCDMIQGYYFSKPVPPEEFEAFIAERKSYAVD